MINILISLAGAAIGFLAFFFGLNAGPVWSLLVGLVILFALNFFLGKRIMNKVTAIMESATKILQKGKFDLAIKTIEEAFQYSKWMLMVNSQIKSQIGMIQYLKKDFNAALPNLEATMKKNWMAMAMLGVTYMRKKENEKMIKTFDKAVKSNASEAIVWNIYAYCLLKTGDRDKAIEVLTKGVKKLKGDDRTEGNLKALQNNAKMKMKSFGDIWYQFHLESVPMSMRMQAGARGAKGGRKIVRR